MGLLIWRTKTTPQEIADPHGSEVGVGFARRHRCGSMIYQLSVDMVFIQQQFQEALHGG